MHFRMDGLFVDKLVSTHLPARLLAHQYFLSLLDDDALVASIHTLSCKVVDGSVGIVLLNAGGDDARWVGTVVVSPTFSFAVVGKHFPSLSTDGSHLCGGDDVALRRVFKDDGVELTIFHRRHALDKGIHALAADIVVVAVERLQLGACRYIEVVELAVGAGEVFHIGVV